MRYLLAFAFATLVAAHAAAAAEVTLTLGYAFPDQLLEAKGCKAVAEDINKAGAGAVKVNVLPFNSIPAFQLPDAVREGRIDITCVSSAFYARNMPENATFWTSNATAAQLRANGGMAMMDQIQQKFFHVKLLGWMPAGGFRFYLKSKPAFTADGVPDFTGIKFRDAPLHAAFIRSLGGQGHSLGVPEVYSALETGVVEAAPWTNLGLGNLGWNKFLKFALNPPYYQTDMVYIMNVDRWRSLDPAARKLIESTVEKHESLYRETYNRQAKDDDSKLKASGLTFVDIPDVKKYREQSVDVAYKEMAERLKSSAARLQQAQQLRAKFQQ